MAYSRRSFFGFLGCCASALTATKAASASVGGYGLKEIGKLPAPLQGAWTVEDRLILLADGTVFELRPDGLEYVASLDRNN